MTEPTNEPTSEPTSEPTTEQRVILEYLDHYREELVRVCEGLSPAQLAERSVPPSTLSLLGLVRHLAKVEHYWTQMVMEDQHGPMLFDTGRVKDADFDGATAEQAVVDAAWEAWRREVAHSRDFEAAHTDLSITGRHHGESLEYRDLLVHLVEEYARHLGHADLLRQVIDGRTAS